MSVELLTEESVIPYLVSRGVFSKGEDVAVETLTGGVSNIVLAVKSHSKDIVLKQALAQLKVATKWVADQRRAIVEAHAIETFHSLSPTQVPALIDCDPEMFTLVIERVPRTSTVWKTDLLEGNIRPEIGAQLGQTLARWHNYGAITPELRERFPDYVLFEQLRISPFYRSVASQNPLLEGRILGLVKELSENQTTLVHGDFSPKNIMVNNDKDIYILDFEVTHTGNPIFDLAFLTAHLLCKFFRTNDLSEAELLRATAREFLDAYNLVHTAPTSSTLGWHTALIALARVEGYSPVNYLDSPAARALTIATKSVLASDLPPQMIDLFTKDMK